METEMVPFLEKIYIVVGEETNPMQDLFGLFLFRVHIPPPVSINGQEQPRIFKNESSSVFVEALFNYHYSEYESRCQGLRAYFIRNTSLLMADKTLIILRLPPEPFFAKELNHKG
jgi:hypothetical protein